MEIIRGTNITKDFFHLDLFSGCWLCEFGLWLPYEITTEHIPKKKPKITTYDTDTNGYYTADNTDRDFYP